VEPTDDSLQAAADFASEGGFEGFVAVGGGTSIDTAKVSDLIATHGGEIMDYVNAPVGGGKKPPSPLKPLLAVPTTAGTGAEATTVAILDVPEQRVKTGISHSFLRCDRGVVDPLLTVTMPPEVTSSCGLDVVCHAAESYISKPYDARPRPESPDDRPPYQGANPVADIWSAKALEYGGKYLRRAVENGDDVEARGAMMLGASLAGIGFGSAGVHIPHACAYPIAGLKHEWRDHREGRREHAAGDTHTDHAGRGRPARGTRARLHRGRRRRPGRRRHETATPARRGAARGHRGGPGEHHPRVHGELVREASGGSGQPHLGPDA
jgi:alcohol dehydrogenase class IV